MGRRTIPPQVGPPCLRGAGRESHSAAAERGSTKPPQDSGAPSRNRWWCGRSALGCFHYVDGGAMAESAATGLAVSGGTIDDRAVVLSEGSGDPQFLHAVLCQLGLPRSPTVNRTFERTSGRASLLLQAGKSFDGKKWVDQPLPSGTRPRLVLINLCSQAVRTQSPEVDIGSSVRAFLRRLGIDAGGESMAQFRKQMMALSSCHMTLAMMTQKGPAQVDAKPIDAFQAWHTNEDGQQALWPGYIRLTGKFFESLMEHAVPLQPEAIGQLQNSAFALDVYSWLAHRLCRVNDPEGVRLSWAALKGQFGQEYADTANFKRKFLGALRKATAAYKEARIETVTGGLEAPSLPSSREADDGDGRRCRGGVRQYRASKTSRASSAATFAASSGTGHCQRRRLRRHARRKCRGHSPCWAVCGHGREAGFGKSAGTGARDRARLGQVCARRALQGLGRRQRRDAALSRRGLPWLGAKLHQGRAAMIESMARLAMRGGCRRGDALA